MANLLVRYRHLIFGLTLLLSVGCAFLIPQVNVNTDLTKYLPSDSHMKAGIDLMNQEFDLSGQMGGADVRVMASHLTDEEKVDLRAELRKYPDVKSVSVIDHDTLTLYELSVPKTVDQMHLGRTIAHSHRKIACVETSQDGTTLRLSLLFSALAILFVILFAMCPSWLEPVLFLLSTGVAVVLNMGTNALLPSVSSTTNSLAAILQLVLSMDYSIILINRYRQERANTTSSTQAMSQAIHKASASIFSSALTTIVGLMMLVFMKIKIGADIGIVLSKGVLFSLICNITILPTLILLFERAIKASHKPVLKIPTNRLSHFSMRHRIPLTILFVGIFVGSYFLHNQTPINFRNNKVSHIDPNFPKKNPYVLIYDNADEHLVAALLDSIQANPHVELATSYPSLMLHEYTAPQMVSNIQGAANLLGSSSNDSVSPISNIDLLSEDILRLIYYAAHNPAPDFALSFGEFADFIIAQSKDPRSIIAAKMDDTMRQKLAALEEFRAIAASMDISDEPAEPYTPDSPRLEPITVPAAPADSTHQPRHTESKALPDQPNQPAEPLATPVADQPATPIYYNPFTDTAQLHRVMNSTRMAATLNMGVTAMGYDLALKESLVKFVYARAKQKREGMTPLEFAHFVTHDLLNHKTIASQIKPDQKDLILRIAAVMDSTEAASRRPQPARPHQPDAPAHPTPIATPSDPVAPQETTLVHTQPAPIEYRTIVRPRPKPEAEEVDTLSLFLELLSPNRRYTAAQMGHNFASLGQGMTPGMVEMLYLYYGGLNLFDSTWTMSLNAIVNYMADTMMHEPRYASFLDDNMRHKFTQVQATLDDNLSKFRTQHHSVALIVTDLPIESDTTYAFTNHLHAICDSVLTHGYYTIGESVMLSEMKSGFSREMIIVTLLTILAILVIVAFTFRSVLVAAVLVMAVMSGVFINVSVSGLGGGSILYLVYLIVQSVLMGAAIDYGILFTNYYRERRRTQNVKTALRKTYKGTINTILTSGLILILVPGAIGIFEQDPSIRAIGRAICVGATATVLIVLFVLPGLIATLDRHVTHRKRPPQKNTPSSL